MNADGQTRTRREYLGLPAVLLVVLRPLQTSIDLLAHARGRPERSGPVGR